MIFDFGHNHNLIMVFNEFIYFILQTAKFVDANMAELVQSVSAVMAIVDALGGMVHQETYDWIAKNQQQATSQDQMRLLYRNTFPPGGVKVKAAFYDALKEHHAELVERLGRI